MARFAKKVQVLLTDEQYQELEELAYQQGKKIGSLVREAIEEHHLRKKREQEIAAAADRILSFPSFTMPESWDELEEELGRLHGMINK
jgi:predicted DNA-binding protein